MKTLLRNTCDIHLCMANLTDVFNMCFGIQEHANIKDFVNFFLNKKDDTFLLIDVFERYSSSIIPNARTVKLCKKRKPLLVKRFSHDLPVMMIILCIR